MDLIHGARDSGGMSQRHPAGLSQWRSGGLESAAIRRALRQRRAGGHLVRCGPVRVISRNGAPGGAATRELGNPPAGLGEPPPAVDISCDRRAGCEPRTAA